MTSFLSWLMSPQDYMPHGMCFLWQPELIALHVVSDSAIALAYYSIPIALIYFVNKRTDHFSKVLPASVNFRFRDKSGSETDVVKPK